MFWSWESLCMDLSGCSILSTIRADFTDFFSKRIRNICQKKLMESARRLHPRGFSVFKRAYENFQTTDFGRFLESFLKTERFLPKVFEISREGSTSRLHHFFLYTIITWNLIIIISISKACTFSVQLLLLFWSESASGLASANCKLIWSAFSLRLIDMFFLFHHCPGSVSRGRETSNFHI